MIIEEAIARHCGDYRDEDLPDAMATDDAEFFGPLGGGGWGVESDVETEPRKYNARISDDAT